MTERVWQSENNQLEVWDKGWGGVCIQVYSLLCLVHRSFISTTIECWEILKRTQPVWNESPLITYIYISAIKEEGESPVEWSGIRPWHLYTILLHTLYVLHLLKTEREWATKAGGLPIVMSCYHAGVAEIMEVYPLHITENKLLWVLQPWASQ